MFPPTAIRLPESGITRGLPLAVSHLFRHEPEKPMLSRKRSVAP
jgi:hypothetical protein